MTGNILNEVYDVLEDLEGRIVEHSEHKWILHYVSHVKKNVSSPLQIMVMGMFSAGKSTFINALIGQEVTVTGVLPTTAVITKLVYGDKESATIYYEDGTREAINIEEFGDITIESYNRSNDFTKPVLYVERSLPIAILKEINIIDSPGLGAIKEEHKLITERFVHYADAIIWVSTIDTAASADEIKAIEKLTSRLKPIAIINKMDTIDEEDDDPEEQLRNISKRLGNRVNKVIGVSSKLAYEGKISKNKAKFLESNFEELETVINKDITDYSIYLKFNTTLDRMGEIIISLLEKNSREIMLPICDRLYDLCKTENIHKSPSLYMILGLTGSVKKLDEKIFVNDLLRAAEEGNFISQILVLNKCVANDKMMKKYGKWLSYIDEDNIKYIELPNIRADIYGILGIGYEEGIIGKKDCKKAEEYYLMAIDNGNLFYKGMLGLMYTNKDSNEYYKPEEGLALREACKNEFPDGEETSYSLFVAYYKIACDTGKINLNRMTELANEFSDVDVYNILAEIYHKGTWEKINVKKDFVEAARWYRKAADIGDKGALSDIIMLLYEEKETGEGNLQLDKFVEIVGEYPDYRYYIILGHTYSKGELGVKNDYNEAIKWYQKAVELGNGDAAIFIAETLMVMSNEGEFSKEEANNAAKECFNKAKELGYDDNLHSKATIEWLSSLDNSTEEIINDNIEEDDDDGISGIGCIFAVIVFVLMGVAFTVHPFCAIIVWGLARIIGYIYEKIKKC